MGFAIGGFRSTCPPWVEATGDKTLVRLGRIYSSFLSFRPNPAWLGYYIHVMNKALRCIGAILLCEAAGILGTFFTVSQIQSWYLTELIRPSFSPPNWLFGPVWTMLYALMGISLFLVWEMKKSKERSHALGVFFLQLALNALWTPIFFGLHATGAAFAVILLMCCTIIWNIIVFYRLKKAAAYLLVPYLLWVSFASVLNGAIWILNR